MRGEEGEEGVMGACCGKRVGGGGKKVLAFSHEMAGWLFFLFLSLSLFFFFFCYAFCLLRSSMAAMSDRLFVAYLSRIVEISFSF